MDGRRAEIVFAGNRQAAAVEHRSVSGKGIGASQAHATGATDFDVAAAADHAGEIPLAATLLKSELGVLGNQDSGTGGAGGSRLLGTRLDDDRRGSHAAGGSSEHRPAGGVVGPILDHACAAVAGQRHLHPTVARAAIARHLKSEIGRLAVGKLGESRPEVARVVLGAGPAVAAGEGQAAIDGTAEAQWHDGVPAVSTQPRGLKAG